MPTATLASPELSAPKAVGLGTRGKSARIIQEWLCLNDFHVRIDSDYGPATERAVRAFQGARALPATGTVDQRTLDALIGPMLQATRPAPAAGRTLGQTVVAVAEQHLAARPREIGGANMGPWVRLYMGGREGNQWLWCAGFVSYVVREAARACGQPLPVTPTFSCDMLAADGQRRGGFVSERQAAAGDLRALVPPGSIFLQRRTPSDWVHTGLVTRVEGGVIETIEGNTNDSGDREGYEVCKRYRAVRRMDFIAIR